MLEYKIIQIACRYEPDGALYTYIFNIAINYEKQMAEKLLNSDKVEIVWVKKHW